VEGMKGIKLRRDRNKIRINEEKKGRKKIGGKRRRDN
jgi:hypothetical protein